MKLQQVQGAENNEKLYLRLRDEMIGRKKAFDQSMSDYKLSLIKAQEEKKRIQAENSTFWG